MQTPIVSEQLLGLFLELGDFGAGTPAAVVRGGLGQQLFGAGVPALLEQQVARAFAGQGGVVGIADLLGALSRAVVERAKSPPSRAASRATSCESK